MRIEQAAAPLGVPTDPVRCGGFWAVWLDDRPTVRFAPGDRRVSPALVDAVLSALADAPDRLARALRLRAPRIPWERLEVSLTAGARVGGEAGAFGSGCIRISAGEDAPAEDVAGIARHEALHLLLASTMRLREAWCEPDLAFAEWIVRGIEAWPGDGIPRFGSELPGLLDPLPTSRLEVDRRLAKAVADPSSALRDFGEPLWAALQRIAPSDAADQRQLSLVEAALGTHYLEKAARLWSDEADSLRPILLDDWLSDYRQYARGVANPPDGSGHLWRLSEEGWTRDPIVRLSVAAQAMQTVDGCWFSDGAPAHDPVIWKHRGRVRLPLLPAPDSARRPPLQVFRAVLQAGNGEARRALAAVEDAARGCERFEARALWPRIAARWLARDLPWPDAAETPRPAVYVVDSTAAYQEWADTARTLRELLRDRAGFVPEVRPPEASAALVAAPIPAASVLLVHGAPPTARSLLAARELAAGVPVRGALFFESLGDGSPWEQVPDTGEPLDPRYREGAWQRGRSPSSLADLVDAVDEATARGQLTSPLSHLLSLAAVGLEECHSPRAPAAALP